MLHALLHAGLAVLCFAFGKTAMHMHAPFISCLSFLVFLFFMKYDYKTSLPLPWAIGIGGWFVCDGLAPHTLIISIMINCFQSADVKCDEI